MHTFALKFAMMSLLDHNAPETDREVGFDPPSRWRSEVPKPTFELTYDIYGRAWNAVEQGIA
jgi:hypothetical protein